VVQAKQKGKQMKKTIQTIAVAVAAMAAVALTGCMSLTGSIQDQYKPIAQNGYTVVADQVQSSHFVINLFGFPISDMKGSPSRRMYEEALKQAPGADALIEYACDTRIWLLGPFTVTCNTLTGTAVKTK
jgi:hypothetical protein